MSDMFDEVIHVDGKTRAIATQLKDRLPVDAEGYPIGLPSERVVRALRPPVGVNGRQWLTALEVATEYFRLTRGMALLSEQAMVSASDLDKNVWRLIYHPDNIDQWHAALALKGMMKKGSGLTFDQHRALRVLTDVTSKGDIKSRLRKLGVSWEVYQNWMRDKKFSEQFKALANDILDQNQAPVLMALTAGAVEGNLAKIEYFHKITGQYQDTQKADVEKFMVGLVEVLQGELKEHPELLRSIAGRLTDLKNRTMG